MKQDGQWKKTGNSVRSSLRGLILFGVLAGSIVLAGCGGGDAEDDTTPAAGNTGAGEAADD